MTRGLYFIPMLARALESDSPKGAVRAALAEISTLGKQHEFRRGFEQFQRFMAAVRAAALSELETAKHQAVEDLIAELAEGTFEGPEEERRAAIDLIRSNERMRALWNELQDVTATAGIAPAITLHLLKNEQVIGTVEFSGSSATGSFGNLSPGDYTLQTNTGRVIWNRSLTVSELIWADAFPGTPFSLAADTADVHAKTTREERLLAGEMTLRVMPGLSSGSMSVSFERGGMPHDA